MSLRWRLTLLYLGATTVIFLMSAAALNQVYRSGVTAAVDRALLRAGDQIADLIEPSNLPLTTDKLQAFSDIHETLFIQVVDPRGPVFFQSDPDLPAVFAAVSVHKTGRGFVTSPIAQGRFLRAAWQQGSPPWRVLIGEVLPFRNQFSDGQGRWAMAVGVGVIALFGALGWALAGRALEPIQHITRVAQAVSQGALDERIPAPGRKDELGGLSEILNQMLSRVELANQKVQHFASNVSHQLRTPLTILRGEIEVALQGTATESELREVLKSNLAELEALSNLIVDLLAFTRQENAGSAEPKPQALDPFLQDVARKASALCRPRHLELLTRIRPMKAVFHAGRLEQALLNVFENAAKYAADGGVISFLNKEDQKEAWIIVQDSGPGMTAAKIRGALERPGASIGLGLAKALVESFSGHFSVKIPEEGGLQVIVRLPLVP